MHRWDAIFPILLATLLCAQCARGADTPPNVVLILVDDLGYNDLGCFGGKDVLTPHIDSLARDGVRFTDGYVTAPVCSPSRAALLTGRYQQRFGHEFNPTSANRPDASFGLPLSERTIADALKTVGYRTAAIGKWHLGVAPRFAPTRRGFDEFFGFLNNKHTMFPAPPASAILRGGNPVAESEYLTDALAREAAAFIDQNHAAPFFLYLPFNATHIPLEASEKYLARFPMIQDPRRRTFAAMLSAVDDAVGMVLAKLREHQIDGNTLVIFLSDNGGSFEENASLNTPLGGTKNFLREGGIRVPFLMRFNAKIPVGKVYSHPVSALDIFPTVLALAGISPAAHAPLDGVDLLPFLNESNKAVPHERFFWRFGDQHAVRQGPWKLLRQGTAPAMLFDLHTDIAESQDLSEKHPDLMKELDAALAKWSVTLAPPKWRAPAPAPPRRSNR